MSKTYADFLQEGANILKKAKFGFSHRGERYDKANWKESGRHSHGAKWLIVIPGIKPSKAVKAIFDHPKKWAFDCSQFCQVINFFAQMKTLNQHHATKFDRQIAASGKPLEIRPFHGAYFTVRKHYYRREKRTEFMKYRVHQNMSYLQTHITAWDLVDAAPIGSRVNFTITGGRNQWQRENAVKVSMRPMKFAAHGLSDVHGVKKRVWKSRDLVIRLAQFIDPSIDNYQDAEKIIWIKEVSIFKNLSLPPHERHNG